MTFSHHHAYKIFVLHASKNTGEKCGAIVVLNNSLYDLKNSANSFHNFFGEFLSDIVFNPSSSYQ